MSTKKTKVIYARVPEEFADQFHATVGKIGFTGSAFIRNIAEAAITQIDAGDDLALPVRLLTVDEKRKRIAQKKTSQAKKKR